MTDLKKLSDEELVSRYKSLKAKQKPKEEKKENLETASLKLGATAANAFLQPDNPLAQGVRRGLVGAAGMVLDTPQNLKDLAVMGLAPIRKVIYPNEELPWVDEKRSASSFLLDATRPAWEYKPQGLGDASLYAGGEVAGAGLIGGTGSPRSLAYNVLIPALGGGAGYAIGGDTGQLVGSIAAPIGVGTAEAVTKGVLRAGARPGSVQALEAAGISPVAGDVGTGAAVAQRALETTPAGYVIGRSVANKRSAALEKGIEDAMPAGRIGSLEAGETISKGLKDWTTRFEANHQKLKLESRLAVPDSTKINLTNTMQVVNELASQPAAVEAVASSTDLSKFRALQKAISSGQLDAGTVRQLKTRVGNLAFPKTALIGDVDSAQYERIWKALAQDMEAGAQSIGQDAFNAMKRENAYYRAGRTRIRDHFDKIVGKVEPQKVFDDLISGGKRGAEELTTVMKSLKKDERDVVASAVLTKLGKPAGSSVDEVFSKETFLTNWRNLTPEAKRALFSGTSNSSLPTTLDKLAKAAMVMRQTERTLPNPSGTGAAVTSGAAVTGMVFEPITTTALVGGTGALETLFTRPWFARWLSDASSLPESALASHLVRFNVLMQRDPELSEFAGQTETPYVPINKGEVDKAIAGIRPPRGAK